MKFLYLHHNKSLQTSQIKSKKLKIEIENETRKEVTTVENILFLKQKERKKNRKKELKKRNEMKRKKKLFFNFLSIYLTLPNKIFYPFIYCTSLKQRHHIYSYKEPSSIQIFTIKRIFVQNKDKRKKRIFEIEYKCYELL